MYNGNHQRRASAASSRNDFGRAANPSDRGGKSIVAKRCKYFNSGQTQSLIGLKSPPSKKNDGRVRSDSGRLGWYTVRPSACLLPQHLFLFQHLHTYFNPFLSVLCFIDAREVISDVRLPAAFVKHSFASCNIIMASGKLDRAEECLGSKRALIYHQSPKLFQTFQFFFSTQFLMTSQIFLFVLVALSPDQNNLLIWTHTF